jgi:cobalamin synthase
MDRKAASRMPDATVILHQPHEPANSTANPGSGSTKKRTLTIVALVVLVCALVIVLLPTVILSIIGVSMFSWVTANLGDSFRLT